MRTLLYLASASPRRHEILNQIGVAHEILHVPSPPGEDEPRLAEESPREYVERTALDKATRAQSWIEKQHSLSLKNEKPIAILTADTTVSLDNLVLGKPKDASEAAKMISQLSGHTHTVLSAVVLSQMKAKQFDSKQVEWKLWKALSVTKVRFCELTDDEIHAYIDTQEPFGKAGAYAIQGHAAKFIQKIEGSYSGVMGLPIFETHALLKKLNL